MQCCFLPGIVHEVVRPTRYRILNLFSGNIVERDIVNMRDRADRADLLKAWNCSPYSYDARTYSDNAEAVPPHPPRAVDSSAHNGTAIKAGQMIALCQQPECTGHPWVVPPEPTPVVGRISRVRGRVATVKWASPAQGDVRESGEPRPSAVTLDANKCLGTISSATGTAPGGSWAFYTGDDPSGGALLDRVVARVKERSATGRVITAFRVRQQGLDPNFDCFCTASFIRRKWPGQAENALKSFDNQARIMDKN